MPILITRPKKEAEQLAKILQAMGLADIIIEPMLTIHPCIAQKIPLQAALARSPQAILVTSKNAVDMLAELTARRDIPVLAVGETSSAHARYHGFKSQACGGDVNALLNYATTQLQPDHGPLLYISGDVITQDFSPLLSEKGFTTEHLTLYHTEPAQYFTDRLKQVFIAREPLAALFYSQRTAAVFNSLIQREQWDDRLAHCQAFVLSRTITSTLEPFKWDSIHTAERPTQEAMITLLLHHLKGSYGK